jgi:hypothetical protein
VAFLGGAPPGVGAAPAPIIGISGAGWGAFLRNFDTMWKHLPLKEMAYGIGRSPETLVTEHRCRAVVREYLPRKAIFKAPLRRRKRSQRRRTSFLRQRNALVSRSSFS